MARWLALDFGQEVATVAIGDGEALVREREWPARQASENGMIEIGRIFAETGTTVANLDALAWISGPGSFTGLRIAAATIQGMAWVWDKPVASIPRLAVLAYMCRKAGLTVPVFACLDARMHELYWACYQITEGVWPEGAIQVGPETDVHLPAGDWTGVGEVLDRVEYQSLRKRMARFESCLPARAGALLPLADIAWCTGRMLDARAIEPLYVRHEVTVRDSSHFSVIRTGYDTGEQK
ncbi:MAG: tRNA (adenosine(37)-N6)-threonylcarbamoyltransferase complex dimerization subunit type 1 TsaB [Gammaproteobacteria bacterium]